MGIIYRIKNKRNGMMYIGQTRRPIEDRWYEHKYDAEKGKSKSPLHVAMRDEGVEHFKVKVVEKCLNEELNDREEFWIKKLNTLNKGYNDFIDRYIPPTKYIRDRTRKKLSELNKKQWADPNSKMRQFSNSEENKARLRKMNEQRMRPVKRLSDGKIFACTADAYRAIGSNKYHMQRHMRRDASHPDINGEVFEYVHKRHKASAIIGGFSNANEAKRYIRGKVKALNSSLEANTISHEEWKRSSSVLKLALRALKAVE